MKDVAVRMQRSQPTRNPSFFFSQLHAPCPTPTTPMPDMRGILLEVLTVVVLASLGGCRCSPPNPQPVTLRIVNGARDPIYVDATRGKLGLTIKRDIGGTLYPFDDLACECRFCERACDPACTCPAVGPDLVRRVMPGEFAERTWNGVVQVSGVTRCGDGSCLSQENAPLNETFTVELCFSYQKPSGANFMDGGIALGTVQPASLGCVSKTFEPQDLRVEIGPGRGAACTSDTDCRGADELCLDGSCTSGCPANDFPELGSAWNLLIPSPDNMGFFTATPRGQGNTLTGTGTLTSFLYAGTGLTLHLSRTDPVTSEKLTGKLTMTLPPNAGAPLVTGSTVSVLVADDGRKPQPSRAVVVRDAQTNQILLAADMSYVAPVLQPAELAPVSIGSGARVLGCRQDACGKLLYTTTTFTSGTKTLELEPGQTGELDLPEGRYRFLNVSSGRYGSTDCEVTSLRPWVFWRQQAP
jgi:hypothetical protein